MDMQLGGLAFMAIMVGQVAAVAAVVASRPRRGAEPEVLGLPHPDYRAMLIWHSGS